MSHEESGLEEEYDAIYETFVEFSDKAEDFLQVSRGKRLRLNNQLEDKAEIDEDLRVRLDEIRKEERELISNYYKLLDAVIRLMKLRYEHNEKVDDMLEELHKVRAENYGSDDVNQVTKTREIIDRYEPEVRQIAEE